MCAAQHATTSFVSSLRHTHDCCSNAKQKHARLTCHLTLTQYSVRPIIFGFAAAAATATARAAPSKTAELYANSEKRPTRVWPTGSPENPLTKVIYWRKAPYVLMKRGGWMRMYGMQPGRAGKVEIILEARGGNQYLLEVPLKQVMLPAYLHGVM